MEIYEWVKGYDSTVKLYEQAIITAAGGMVARLAAAIIVVCKKEK